MKQPTQTLAFDLLYSLAAENGREEKLFGNSIEAAAPAFERMRIGSGYPTVYLEFPLLGSPCFDMLSVYGTANIGPDDRFASGAGFGYGGMFRWFSSLPDKSGCSCGIELDTGSGETERAGIYFQYRSNLNYAEPFLGSVGESARKEGFLDAVRRLPEGLPAAYVGLFPGREGSPMRIGGYMNRGLQEAVAGNPDVLGKAFRQIGFSTFRHDMLAFCAELMKMVPAIDFQFDLFPDGTIGDVFGLSLSFNEVKPSESAECMEKGYGAKVMQRLQRDGLADERWKAIAGAAYAKAVPVETDDGKEALFAALIRLNYAKIKFKAGDPMPAKFYYMTKAALLPTQEQA